MELIALYITGALFYALIDCIYCRVERIMYNPVPSIYASAIWPVAVLMVLWRL